jgi:CDP-diacylglycerol--glycerol-3-phosphate 3-phosphatidyltransferase
MSVESGVLLGVLSIAAVSMVAYVIDGTRRDPDAARKGTAFLLGRGDFLLHWLLWVLGPIERGSLRFGLSPRFFNIAGVGLAALGGLLVGARRLELGGWAIAAGGLCDILDGRIARARGVSSAYGAFVDSTLDRFAEAFVLLGFAFYLRSFSAGPLVTAGALAGSMLVSYARARGESLGVLCKEGLMRRGERLALLFLVCMLDRPIAAWADWPRGWVALWGLGVLCVGTFFTALHRTVWISRRLRELGR